MSESFRRSAGRKVLSRSSAKELGAVSHLLVDAQQRRIAAVVVGRGKKAQLVDWARLSGFGPDAVMVVDEGALRPPAPGQPAKIEFAHGQRSMLFPASRRGFTCFGLNLAAKQTNGSKLCYARP